MDLASTNLVVKGVVILQDIKTDLSKKHNLPNDTYQELGVSTVSIGKILTNVRSRINTMNFFEKGLLFYKI